MLGKHIKPAILYFVGLGCARMKRPPSYSDSYIVIGNYRHGSVEIDTTPLNIRIPESLSINAAEFDATKETAVVEGGSGSECLTLACKIHVLRQHCEHICENLLRFVFHIMLISIFETIFFFKFVSVDEDRGILSTTNFYTHGLISKCANFNYNETTILNNILRNLVNASNVIQDGVAGRTERNTYNAELSYLSWKYAGGLSGLVLFLMSISLCCRFKMRWAYIIIENIALVSMLGLYEFMFFETVVKKYKTESPQEISSLFVQGLQQTCRLLT